ncbi:MAG: hypothetical protein WC515_06500 [Candidatus Omnitrophota bacterium]
MTSPAKRVLKMKKIFTVIIAITAAVFILAVTKDMIIKASVEKGVEMVTGLKMDIGSFRVGLVRTVVEIRDLRLFNPGEFSDRVMLDMPRIYVDYDIQSIMKGTVHLAELRLSLTEFYVVKNKKGELNLDALKVVQAGRKGERPSEMDKGKTPRIQIDVLELNIGKVIFKDYSVGPSPSVKVYDIDHHEEYTDITDPYSLVSLIVVRSLRNTAISNFTSFDLNKLEGTVSGTLDKAGKVAGKTVEKAESVAKALSGMIINPLGAKKE